MTFALDAITHISTTTAGCTASSATSHPPNSRRSTTLEPGPTIKPQHQPGPDARDRPVQSRMISPSSKTSMVPPSSAVRTKKARTPVWELVTDWPGPWTFWKRSRLEADPCPAHQAPRMFSWASLVAAYTLLGRGSVRPATLASGARGSPLAATGFQRCSDRVACDLGPGRSSLPSLVRHAPSPYTARLEARTMWAGIRPLSAKASSIAAVPTTFTSACRAASRSD